MPATIENISFSLPNGCSLPFIVFDPVPVFVVLVLLDVIAPAGVVGPAALALVGRGKVRAEEHELQMRTVE